MVGFGMRELIRRALPESAHDDTITEPLLKKMQARYAERLPLLPGAVAFPGSYWDEQSREKPERMADFLRHHQAVGRMGTPEEVAWVVTFLCTERARHITGEVIKVDGGQYI